MATIDLTAMLGSGTYDDITGNVTFTVATGLILDESVVIAICDKLESRALSKRTDINFPISEKAFPDNPSSAITARSNVDGTVTETQIERQLNLVCWYKAPTLTASNAVNNND